jgi:HPt (histidine-containing phosphotransfer) domain-containing protein
MSNDPVLDPQALEAMLEMVGGDEAFLGEMIDTYLADSASLLATMGQALAGADAPELRRAAHALKSNSASFGAAHLAELSRRLEDLAKAGDLGPAPPLLAAAEAAFATVAPALRAARPG